MRVRPSVLGDAIVEMLAIDPTTDNRAAIHVVCETMIRLNLAHMPDD